MSADIGQVSDAGPLLVVDNVSKKFGGVLALSAVSLEVNRGDIVGIIGPNGSGKTTLVNTITGFIKPDKGRILFKGGDITGWRPSKIAGLGSNSHIPGHATLLQLACFQESHSAAFLSTRPSHRRMERRREKW